MHNLIIFGEVLFDQFPDSRMLGGAPFNVAWHLRGLGENPLLITRLGDDDPGHEALERMAGWGLQTEGIQIDQDHPTGMVEVTLKKGQPSFDIKPEQAYDFIDSDIAIQLLNDCQSGSLFYHGSLALRHRVSRNSWNKLNTALNPLRFVDLNLRQPWWNHALLPIIMPGTDHLKLNHEELAKLAARQLVTREDYGNAATSLAKEHQIQTVYVTMGSRGAMFCLPNGQYQWANAPTITDIKDTVGAGDAFSAVLLYGLIHGWNTTQSVQRAIDLAAEICSHRGALIMDSEFYSNLRLKWKRKSNVPTPHGVALSNPQKGGAGSGKLR